jgi:hypothetical protein
MNFERVMHSLMWNYGRGTTRYTTLHYTTCTSLTEAHCLRFPEANLSWWLGQNRWMCDDHFSSTYQ